MQNCIVQKIGFPIDTGLAAEFNLLDEFLLWEEQKDSEEFCTEFENRFGIYPEDLCRFEYDSNGHIKELEGFEWGTAYVIFDETPGSSAELQKLDEILEEQDVTLKEGEWLEMN